MEQQQNCPRNYGDNLSCELHILYAQRVCVDISGRLLSYHQ
jgi:hypothetical protein